MQKNIKSIMSICLVLLLVGIIFLPTIQAHYYFGSHTEGYAFQSTIEDKFTKTPINTTNFNDGTISECAYVQTADTENYTTQYMNKSLGLNPDKGKSFKMERTGGASSGYYYFLYNASVQTIEFDVLLYENYNSGSYIEITFGNDRTTGVKLKFHDSGYWGFYYKLGASWVGDDYSIEGLEINKSLQIHFIVSYEYYDNQENITLSYNDIVYEIRNETASPEITDNIILRYLPSYTDNQCIIDNIQTYNYNYNYNNIAYATRKYLTTDTLDRIDFDNKTMYSNLKTAIPSIVGSPSLNYVPGLNSNIALESGSNVTGNHYYYIGNEVQGVHTIELQSKYTYLTGDKAKIQVTFGTSNYAGIMFIYHPTGNEYIQFYANGTLNATEYDVGNIALGTTFNFLVSVLYSGGTSYISAEINNNSYDFSNASESIDYQTYITVGKKSSGCKYTTIIDNIKYYSTYYTKTNIPKTYHTFEPNNTGVWTWADVIPSVSDPIVGGLTNYTVYNQSDLLFSDALMIGAYPSINESYINESAGRDIIFFGRNNAQWIRNQSNNHTNIKGVIIDDVSSGLVAGTLTEQNIIDCYNNIHYNNSNLSLYGVVYYLDLYKYDFSNIKDYIDIVIMWMWDGSNIYDLPTFMELTKDTFPDSGIMNGLYIPSYGGGNKIYQNLNRIQYHYYMSQYYKNLGLIDGIVVFASRFFDQNGSYNNTLWIKDWLLQDYYANWKCNLSYIPQLNLLMNTIIKNETPLSDITLVDRFDVYNSKLYIQSKYGATIEKIEGVFTSKYYTLLEDISDPFNPIKHYFTDYMVTMPNTYYRISSIGGVDITNTGTYNIFIDGVYIEYSLSITDGKYILTSDTSGVYIDTNILGDNMRVVDTTTGQIIGEQFFTISGHVYEIQDRHDYMLANLAYIFYICLIIFVVMMAVGYASGGFAKITGGGKR